MKHEEYRELLVLSLNEELDSVQEADLQKHLLDCRECRTELEELKSLDTLLSETSLKPPSHVLWRSRERLFTSLGNRGKVVREAGGTSFFSDLLLVFRKPALATAGLSMAALGLLVGYVTFSPGTPQGSDVVGLDPFSTPGLRISNVRFEGEEQSPDRVKLTFSASRQFELMGSAQNPKIQQLLTYALLHEQNPGVRLRAIDTIGSHPATDKTTEAALVSALKTDDNVAVRQNALNALSAFPMTPSIKNALLHVLQHDQNARLRIGAIDALTESATGGQQIEADVLDVFKSKAQDEKNDYIRLRAKTFLLEAGYESNQTEVM